MSVAIDAMVLIWFLKRPHYKGRKPTAKASLPAQDVVEMQKRAYIFMETMAQEETTVIVPTMAAAELLLGVDPTEHGQVLAELNARFLIAPFDVQATAIAARLWQETSELPESERPTRVCLKADVTVVATAKAARATHFCSHDKRLRALAQRAGLEARDLPVRSPDMFLNLEAEKAAKNPPEKKQ